MGDIMGDSKLDVDAKVDQQEVELSQVSDVTDVREGETPEVQYKLYKRRWIGLVSLILLNIVSSINWALFSSIADDTSAYFRLSLTKINWFSNIVCGLYIPVAPCIPFLLAKIGFRYIIILGAVIQTIGAWLRYASYPLLTSTSNSGSYALLFLGSIFIGLSQPLLLCLGPLYSERWMAPNFRTISTMLIAVSNPVGAAISYIISPAIVTKTDKDFKTLLILIGILTSVLSLPALGVLERPPTPPSRSAFEDRPKILEGFKAIFAVGEQGAMLNKRKRLDFAIICYTYTIFLAFFSAFSTLINQIFEPYGYSSDAAGFIGSALILAGLLGAGLSAPIIDRYFPHHQAIVARTLVPLISITYLCYIWAIKENDYPGIYTLAIINGASSFSLLPVALELAVEVTYPVLSPGTTSSILYLFGNGFTVIAVVVMDALRAGKDASPPQNMRKSLIFQGVIAAVTAFPVFALRGKQDRRLEDERKVREGKEKAKGKGIDEVVVVP